MANEKIIKRRLVMADENKKEQSIVKNMGTELANITKVNMEGGITKVNNNNREEGEKDNSCNMKNPINVNVSVEKPIDVSLVKPEIDSKRSILWAVIKGNTLSLSDFLTTENFLNVNTLNKKENWCRDSFVGINAYAKLKETVERYIREACTAISTSNAVKTVVEGVYKDKGIPFDENEVRAWYTPLELSQDTGAILPYMSIIKNRLGEYASMTADEQDVYNAIIECKLTHPLLIELIWSYWHEESMLVQAMNAICLRFQNKKSGYRNPIENLNLDPIRPLSNIIWGYIQDEQHRLTLQRRAYEYDHEYGLKLCGKAVPAIESVESRSKFIEAFHNLLYLCFVFFKQDDDQMVNADGFPVLNSLKDIQILLTQGMHNQWGDLTCTSRVEMLTIQWILSRTEMKEFIGGRTMVPYPEKWMDHLDTIKTMQGWTDVSSVHFNELATYGEQILLSIRFGNWSQITDRDVAANWVRFWRSEIQRYIYAYRVTTGIDLTNSVRADRPIDSTMPSVLLSRRLEEQTNRR